MSAFDCTRFRDVASSIDGDSPMSSRDMGISLVQVGACHLPARNGPMATAGRLLLLPTPPKASQVPHDVPGTHTHRTGAL